MPVATEHSRGSSGGTLLDELDDLDQRAISEREAWIMSADAAAGWNRPPVEGYKWDDLDRIPDLPPHTELIDGSIVLVSPQKDFHTLVVDALVSELRACISGTPYRVRREMTIVLDEQQRPEPDVILLHADATGFGRTWYPGDAVVLAVEVVSPDSEARDRKRKPQLYAEAGIAHFWRVENVDDKPVVHAYELQPDIRQYDLVGIFHDRVRLDRPIPIDIDLSVIDRM